MFSNLSQTKKKDFIFKQIGNEVVVFFHIFYLCILVYLLFFNKN